MALEARVVMTAIPALNSLAGAAATLYLDFDGHFQSSWGSYSNIDTPPYDQDGNTSSFSDSEVASIRQIWEYVAEDYAPFNINVSTVEPPSFNNGEALRIAIGGDSSWLGSAYGGVAYRNSFSNSYENVVFVFPKNLSNGNPKYVGDVSSHESGHGFGLAHQSKFDSSGSKLQEYSTGTDGGKTAPIMGNSTGARRGLWWYGTTTSATTYQDDMAIIARSTNGFGYRADDHGGSAGSASPLTVSGTAVSGSGIITQTTDQDFFSFSTGTGTVSVTISTPALINNLAPRLELRDANGSTIALAGPTSNFDATITASLAAGSYHIVVASDGAYSSVGQYFVNGTIVASGDLIDAPTNLVASAVSTSRINLSWLDNASNETGYRVERSLDGVTWTLVTSALAAGSTSYSDSSALAGTTYSYRVQADSDSATSGYSNAATATTITLAPGSLTASAVSSSRIDLSWSDVNGETGYRVERSTDGTNWFLAGTTGAGVTSFSDNGRSASTTYSYRIQAVNSGGGSAYSNTASATTLDAPTVPAAPSGLVASAMSSSRIDLTWSDVEGLTSYQVERSVDGTNWTIVGTTGADVTAFSDTGLAGSTTYSYRIQAINDAGASPYSTIASATTLASSSTPPAPPSNLTADANRNRVMLQWSDNSVNEAGFRVERSSDNGTSWSVIAEVGVDSKNSQDRSVRSGQTYLYRVRSFNAAGESAASNEVRVTIPSRGGGGPSNAPGMNPAPSNSAPPRSIDDFLEFGCGCSACRAAAAAVTPDVAPQPAGDAITQAPSTPHASLLFSTDPPAYASPTPARLSIASGAGSTVDLILETQPTRRPAVLAVAGRPWWVHD
jgi:fibronectin type 3 domain-containing protein